MTAFEYQAVYVSLNIEVCDEWGIILQTEDKI